MSNDRHTMFFMGNEYPNYGGGGGGSFSSEKIYTNSEGSAPATIQLSKAITDFDAIILNGYRNNMTTYYSSNMYLTEEVVSGRIICLTDDSFYAWYTVTNDTTLTSAGANIVITDIYGIKFGGGSSGGGGGSSYSESYLYENQTTGSEATITLTDDLSNYDELFFDIYRVADSRNYHVGKSYKTSVLSINDYLQILVYQNEYESWQITSETLLTRVNRGGNIYVKRIIGVKY